LCTAVDGPVDFRAKVVRLAAIKGALRQIDQRLRSIARKDKNVDPGEKRRLLAEIDKLARERKDIRLSLSQPPESPPPCHMSVDRPTLEWLRSLEQRGLIHILPPASPTCRTVVVRGWRPLSKNLHQRSSARTAHMDEGRITLSMAMADQGATVATGPRRLMIRVFVRDPKDEPDRDNVSKMLIDVATATRLITDDDSSGLGGPVFVDVVVGERDRIEFTYCEEPP
jgi:Holliday junction resolvase RusA-like endonuclease